MATQVLTHYIDRLTRGVSRSAVLRAFPTRTIKRIDLDRFTVAGEGAPNALVGALVQPEGRYRLDLRDLGRSGGRGEESRQLFTTLKTSLMREAREVQRETGLWALWLAYPLLYIPHPDAAHDEFILAPLLLFPVTVESTNLPQGHLDLRRLPGAPRFNRVATQWISRKLGFEMSAPSGTQLLGLDGFDAVSRIAGACCSTFNPPIEARLGPAVRRIPERGEVATWKEPRLLDAGILGLVLWENMELLADLERLRSQEHLPGLVGDFLGEHDRQPEPRVTPPEEVDRYLVADADHCQETAVWKARRPEGLVAHGPPGTGKSQVIVSIVADALAHGERVLVVCQKKAALDVVSSRLRAVQLAELTCQVDDVEADRSRVIESLRNQQPPVPLTDQAARDRAAWATEIEEIERKFERYSTALFQVRDQFGINYQTVLARLARIEREHTDTHAVPAARRLLRDIRDERLRQLCATLAALQTLWQQADLPRNPWLRKGRADLTGDPHQGTEIAQTLDRALALTEGLDRVGGPAHGVLKGDLRTIHAAAETLAKLWPKVPATLVGSHTGAPTVELDAKAYQVAAGALEAWVAQSKLIFPWVRPSFRHARRTVRSFASSRPWTLATTAVKTFREIAARAKVALDLLGAIHTWLHPSATTALEHDVRAAKPVGALLRDLRQYLPRLLAVVQYKAMLQALDERGRLVVDAITDAQGIAVTDWARATELSALLEWAGRIERELPILHSYLAELQRNDREHLEELARKKRGVEAGAIRTPWSKRWSGIDHPWRHGLQLQGRTARRLREIVEDGRTRGLFDLRPCWLANPGTVSQLFPLEAGLFDLVVFDEASQCPPEYAIAALYRGKRVVVAGDAKQLPPTMFFKSTFQLDGGEDQGGEDDAPIDVAIAGVATDLLSLAQARLPEAHLNVHYRSLDPALIAFSNAAFYANRLEIPHPARPRTAGETPALFLDHLGAGPFYTRSQTNPTEARRVVDTLRQLWLEANDRSSVGVITFNEHQKEKILNLVADECEKDSQFRAAYERALALREDGQDVGFFVRSLEAVQGDERDAIIFSTTYGRREDDGVFSRAFLGPLTQPGGERRLNVAITRAKRWVRIVSSLPIGELASTLAPGVVQTQDTAGRAMLQLYLTYAEHLSRRDQRTAEDVLRRAAEVAGALGTHAGTVGTEQSEFEREVRVRIEQALGVEIDCQIGSGAFRIDLAVRHPQGGYLLGIECDGKAYHSGLSARAYDVWRQRILEQRGWRIHRIWSTSWRSDPDGEIRKVEERLQQLAGDGSSA